MFDVIIPARNEEKTIGSIVKTFMDHPEIGQVIVVIDTETADETADEALKNRAKIVYGKRGKGQNVGVGVGYVKTANVILCDADITGLTSVHVDTLTQVNPAVQELIIGVPDFPARDIINSQVVQERPEWLESIVRSFHWVSGERVIPKWVLTDLELHGYLMEVQINARCHDVGIVPEFRRLHGVYSPFSMSAKRLEEMARDREWGVENGWLPPQ